MAKIRHMAGSFVIMFIMITLILNAWDGFKAGYDITEENLQDGKNIFQKLKGLSLIKGVNDLTIGLQGIFKLNEPGGDLLGAIALSASGTLQVIGGIVLFPFQIFGIITGFYTGIIPPGIDHAIGVLGVMIVGFIILSAKLGHEV